MMLMISTGMWTCFCALASMISVSGFELWVGAALTSQMPRCLLMETPFFPSPSISVSLVVSAAQYIKLFTVHRTTVVYSNCLLTSLNSREALTRAGRGDDKSRGLKGSQNCVSSCCLHFYR
jgi:hypothetical protein